MSIYPCVGIFTGQQLSRFYLTAGNRELNVDMMDDIERLRAANGDACMASGAT